jgi:hypothetical protein
MAYILIDGAYAATGAQLAAATDNKTTLAATLTAGATSMTLAAALAGVTGETFVRIDNEIIKVTAGLSSTTPTIQRAQAGTTAVEHASGSKVFPVLTATGLETYVTEQAGSSGNVILTGTWAAQQAYSTSGLNAGDMWIFTDANTIDRAVWDGSAWDYFEGGLQVTPMLSGNWTTKSPTTGTLTVTYIRGAALMECINTNYTPCAIYQNVPAESTFVIDVKVSYFQRQFGNGQFGLVLANSSAFSNPHVRQCEEVVGGGTPTIQTQEYSSGSPVQSTSGWEGTEMEVWRGIIFRFERTGTGRTMYISHDNGVKFRASVAEQIWTYGSVTPAVWGVWIAHNNSDGKERQLTVHWTKRVS